MSTDIPRPDWVSDALVEDRGENAGFQMYTREGNDAVAEMLRGVMKDGREKLMMRGAIIERLQQGVKQVRRVHPEIYDTEPEWAIVDAMNVWLAEMGFLAISRDDLS